MEGEEGDALCGLALDSVMQKAAELETSLRDWKEHLAILGSAGTSEAHSLDSARHSPSPPSLVGRGGGGEGGGGGGEGGRGRGGGAEQSSPHTEKRVSVGTTAAWHQLTRYIVELEGRLQQLQQGGGGGER